MIIPRSTEQQEREVWQYLTVLAVAWPRFPISVHVGDQQPGAYRPIHDMAKTAMTFMNRCLDEHAQCAAARTVLTEVKHPTRLVELSESTARIIDTAPGGILERYVALSYCWGPNPNFLRLTEWNKDELQSGFPLDHLPCAFQEAIQLVKDLGCWYI